MLIAIDGFLFCLCSCMLETVLCAALVQHVLLPSGGLSVPFPS